MRCVADDDFTPWTPAGAERLRAAAAELAAAVTAHAEAVAAVRGDDDVADVFAAGDRLLPVLLAYADAQFDLTGTDFPLGVLQDAVDDEDADEDGDGASVGVVGTAEPAEGGTSAAAGTTEVTVLQQHHLLVTDEAAVLAAGRRAQPDGEGAEGPDLGQALSRLADAGGWDSLGDVRGLRPTARSVLVVGRDVVPGRDADDADDEGELLYSRQDVFPG